MTTTTCNPLRFEEPAIFERWYVLAVTCVIYAIDIANRYAVTTVLEPIRVELLLSDAGVAFLTGVPLALFYVACGIPVSWFADRSNRRNMLTVFLVAWSGFTVVCGLAQNYWQLLLGRLGVGIGKCVGVADSLRFLWRQKAAVHVIMGRG